MCVQCIFENELSLYMDSELQTPLTQLPENNENDTDLVNKILNQLDNTSDEEVTPSFDEQNIPSTTIEPPPPPSTQPSVILNTTPEVMPNPQSIQNWMDSIDIVRAYDIIKKSLLYSILFLVFVMLTNNFRTIFSKITFITTSVGTELNTSGKVLQALCFGLTTGFIQVMMR